MTDPNIVTQEEMALRRRARRRLVGAVAIALTAVVVLPMVFDPEPKPLGPDVDLRIPAKDTPFEPLSGVPAEAPVAVEPAVDAKVAEPTQAPPPADTKPVESKQTDTKPAESKPVIEAKSEKTLEKPEAPARKKVDEAVKPATKPVAKAESKVSAKADAAFASRGFFLQLGAFTNEANAKQLLEKVQAAGFKVSLNDANGQYRVRVGPIPEHDKALEMQSKLKAKGFSPVMLGP